MRIAFVQTYPIYHDLLSKEEWLQRINRDRWMPAITAEMGHEVELWGADHTTSEHTSDIEGFVPYPIRLFESDKVSSHTKKHYSSALVEYAGSYDADLHILKGVDGRIGTRLLKKYVRPEGKPFVFVIGGKYYTRMVPRARAVFYETEEQREALANPGLRFWRRPVPDRRLIKLPKSVDTDLFRPNPDVPKEWDIICVGRLINRYKNYEAVGRLSETFDVAVVGGGEAKEELERKYPGVDWIGKVPNREVPGYLRRAHAFMHTGYRDFFPRVIAEAAACGCILLGFAEALAEDVIPPECGLRLSEGSFVREIKELFEDRERMEEMSRNARERAQETFHKRSAEKPLKKMMERLDI